MQPAMQLCISFAGCILVRLRNGKIPLRNPGLLVIFLGFSSTLYDFMSPGEVCRPQYIDEEEMQPAMQLCISFAGCILVRLRNGKIPLRNPGLLVIFLGFSSTLYDFMSPGDQDCEEYGRREGGGVGHVPSGWDAWFGLVGNSKYYNYSLSENGHQVHYKHEYLTDVIRKKAIAFVEDYARRASPGGGVFMVMAPPAPHAPFTPAERHRGRFPTARTPRTPAFNHTPAQKHWLLQMPPRHLPEDVSRLDEIQQHRLEALLAVDDLVRDVVTALEQHNMLENSYIMYTSDNGFHIGQFGQPWDKRQPYETDIRVPLLLRGPRLPRKRLTAVPVQLSDLVPTILQDMASLAVPADMDGRPVLDLVLQDLQHQDRATDGGQNNKSKLFEWKRSLLVEHNGEGNGASNDGTCPWQHDVTLSECSQESWCKCQDSINNTYSCVRELSTTVDFLFCSFTDTDNFKEAYDMKIDKYQLHNIYKEMKQEDINKYSSLLKDLMNCHGSECRKY